MKRMSLATTIVIGIALSPGGATAQTAPPAAASKDGARSKPAAETAPSSASDHAKMPHGSPGKGGKAEMMGGRMMGHGSQGKGGMMAGGMMGTGGMCPMVVGTDTKVQVKNLPKGVTITFTNDDAAVVAKLQKTAEAMRLMQEAQAP